MATKKLTKNQLKKLVKESFSAYEAEQEKMASFSPEVMRYPSEMRALLSDLEEAGLLTWSNDAGVQLKGRGYFISANKLVQALRFMNQLR